MVVPNLFKWGENRLMNGFIPHSKPTINAFDVEAVSLQLKSNFVAKGQAVSEFEKQIEICNQINHAVCTTSGSSALQSILLGMMLPQNSEVIMPSYVCKSVYNSIIAAGLIPVLCDIGTGWTMTYDSVNAKFSSKTSAIILVHTFGIDAWDERFSHLKIPVIEDFCQGFALHKYSKRILKGIAGFCSFNATKYITTGEGGAVITNNSALHNSVKNVILENRLPGVFSDLQASLGISQLNQFPNFVKARFQIIEKYMSSISDKESIKQISLVKDKSIYFRFLIDTKNDVQKMIMEANKKGIAIRRGVDAMLHSNTAAADFPNTEKRFSSTASLPVYPSLTQEEQDRIIVFINRYEE